MMQHRPADACSSHPGARGSASKSAASATAGFAVRRAPAGGGRRRGIALGALCAGLVCSIAGSLSAAPPDPVAEPKRPVAGPGAPADQTSTEKRETLKLRGRVVWLADALKRQHGISTVPEAARRTLALETKKGEIHPIVEDVRGRAFRADERLRTIDLLLVARRYAGSPMVQVISMYEIRGKQYFRLDYWCDICAISMAEKKPCDCCQAATELRRRKVVEVP